MVGAGLITTIPLLFFASAAQRIPLTTIGVMHYITPTLQLLLGVLVYKEAFSATQALGFGIVWIGLIIFCAEGFLSRLNSRAAANFRRFQIAAVIENAKCCIGFFMVIGPPVVDAIRRRRSSVGPQSASVPFAYSGVIPDLRPRPARDPESGAPSRSASSIQRG